MISQSRPFTLLGPRIKIKTRLLKNSFLGIKSHLVIIIQVDNIVLKYLMHRIIKDNTDKIQSLCANHNVKSLYTFGSVCTGHFDDSSDIDLLISFKPMDYGDYADNYFLIADKFEELFQRSVDLVTDKSLSNPFFIDSVNQTKTLIYG